MAAPPPTPAPRPADFVKWRNANIPIGSIVWGKAYQSIEFFRVQCHTGKKGMMLTRMTSTSEPLAGSDPVRHRCMVYPGTNHQTGHTKRALVKWVGPDFSDDFSLVGRYAWGSGTRPMTLTPWVEGQQGIVEVTTCD